MEIVFFNILIAIIVSGEKLVKFQETKNGKVLMRFLILTCAYLVVILALIYSLCI